MTIREQLESEMDKQEILELEEENADSEKFNKNSIFNINNHFNTTGSN